MDINININMKILVTGGAGFIGSHIVDKLLKLGHTVRVVDNLSTGSMKNVELFTNNKNYEFIYGDISDIEVCRKAVKNINMVSHQAAIGSVPRSIDDPLTSHKANVDGFFNILVASKDEKINRIVYASSSSVYGDDTTLPKKEDKTGKLLSPYAGTKAIDEIYGGLFTRCYNMECIGLRYFNVFGQRQNPNGCYAAVIPKFIMEIHKNIRPTINGDGNYSRDFTFVENVVKANIIALFTENRECFGDVFNIGAGGRITLMEMFNMICEIMGKSNITPIFGEFRKGDISHSNADISKAMEKLEYTPNVSFYEGLRRTISYFLLDH